MRRRTIWRSSRHGAFRRSPLPPGDRGTQRTASGGPCDVGNDDPVDSVLRSGGPPVHDGAPRRVRRMRRGRCRSRSASCCSARRSRRGSRARRRRSRTAQQSSSCSAHPAHNRAAGGFPSRPCWPSRSSGPPSPPRSAPRGRGLAARSLAWRRLGDWRSRWTRCSDSAADFRPATRSTVVTRSSAAPRYRHSRGEATPRPSRCCAERRRAPIRTWRSPPR